LRHNALAYLLKTSLVTNACCTKALLSKGGLEASSTALKDPRQANLNKVWELLPGETVNIAGNILANITFSVVMRTAQNGCKLA